MSVELRYTKENKYISPPEFEQKTTLDFIQITLNEKNYNKLKKKRDKALSVGILETRDTDYVPATITFNGVDYKANIRLKGDWVDHLRGDKWSFRVKLKGDETILGMRKFSIHHPTTRGYVNEWLYHKATKDENLFGLRYNFLEGSIHIKGKNSSEFIDKNLGIYAIEETFDKRAIENNKRKESVILKFSEDYWWDEVKKATLVGADYGLKGGSGGFMDWQQHLIDKFPITLFSEEKMLSDSIMLSYFKLSKNLLEDVRSSKASLDYAFDVEKLAMQNAILNLFGAIHGTYSINLRFYYNPITSKLEPISFDGNSGLKLKKYEHFIFVNQEKDSVYLKELAYAINKVSQPEYLNDLMNKHKKGLDYFQKVLKTEFNRRFFDEKNLRFNQSIMKQELQRLTKQLNLPDIEIKNALRDSLKLIANESKKTIISPALNITKWSNTRAIIEKANGNRNNKDIYKISRENTSESSYVYLNNINVSQYSIIKTSVVVKRGTKGSLFGLRIQGRYPNRVDAVFDLDNGVITGKSNGGDFENEKAEIQSLGKGWYRCSISGLAKTNRVKIILGPTTNERRILSWEGATKENCDLYFIPKSLKIEEISQ